MYIYSTSIALALGTRTPAEIQNFYDSTPTPRDLHTRAPTITNNHNNNKSNKIATATNTATTTNALNNSNATSDGSSILCEPCNDTTTGITAIKQSKSALKKTKRNGATSNLNTTNFPTPTTTTAATTNIPSSNPPTGNLTEQSRLNIRKGGFKKEYEPCDHPGICTISNCICVQNSGFCEKYCACTRGCRHRFQGCCCKGKTGMYSVAPYNIL